MAQPRFQLVHLSRRSPGLRSDSSEARGDLALASGDPRFVWRLLGGNNRELGRSVGIYELAEECERAITDMKRRFPDDLDPRITFDPGHRGWRWRISIDRRAIAESSRAFSRQRECRYNLEQFLVILPRAELRVPRKSSAALPPAPHRRSQLSQECG